LCKTWDKIRIGKNNGKSDLDPDRHLKFSTMPIHNTGKRKERVFYLAAAGGSDYERWALGRPTLLSSAPLVLTLTATQFRNRQAFDIIEDKAVFRIRVVYPGSWIQILSIPDPNFSITDP
jgi:hypothetical protein